MGGTHEDEGSDDEGIEDLGEKSSSADKEWMDQLFEKTMQGHLNDRTRPRNLRSHDHTDTKPLGTLPRGRLSPMEFKTTVAVPWDGGTSPAKPGVFDSSSEEEDGKMGLKTAPQAVCVPWDGGNTSSEEEDSTTGFKTAPQAVPTPRGGGSFLAGPEPFSTSREEEDGTMGFKNAPQAASTPKGLEAGEEKKDSKCGPPLNDDAAPLARTVPKPSWESGAVSVDEKAEQNIHTAQHVPVPFCEQERTNNVDEPAEGAAEGVEGGAPYSWEQAQEEGTFWTDIPTSSFNAFVSAGHLANHDHPYFRNTKLFEEIVGAYRHFLNNDIEEWDQNARCEELDKQTFRSGLDQHRIQHRAIIKTGSQKIKRLGRNHVRGLMGFVDLYAKAAGKDGFHMWMPPRKNPVGSNKQKQWFPLKIHKKHKDDKSFDELWYFDISSTWDILKEKLEPMFRRLGETQDDGDNRKTSDNKKNKTSTASGRRRDNSVHSDETTPKKQARHMEGYSQVARASQEIVNHGPSSRPAQAPATAPAEHADPISDGSEVLCQGDVLTTACEDKKPEAQEALADFTTDFTRENSEHVSQPGTSGGGLERPPALVRRIITINAEGNPMNVYYCWTHGLSFTPGHTSSSCSDRAEGHQESATLDNMMGGNNRIQPYVPGHRSGRWDEDDVNLRRALKMSLEDTDGDADESGGSLFGSRGFCSGGSCCGCCGRR